MNCKLVLRITLLAPIAFLAFALISAYAGGPVMPTGWRLPSESELSDEWRSGKYRNAQAIGDFNGDGLIEGAFLAVSTDGKSEALLAFVYDNNTEKWFVLDRREFRKTVLMGLDLYKPGKYRVLCDDDDKDVECRYEKKIVVLHTDALRYFKPESASSVFVWNNAKGKFIRIWESD